ncbi:MAG: biopolymer transport protein ExbB [Candidatus Magnetoglobus multicellularis str. Araruama]|uniref:Biopolymer transport protein ExbB n=1 Tax=Candidatus Magnetoglobus multicellularis str. Araruama TaxID=890399 RepID=A0A1V1P4Q2_9BACT|nr:MAG: biopolymer transport protein ExbB [Candidatus Magnetoglobus multicellularis str. Araruama]
MIDSNIISFISKGGVLVIPIFLCSVIALAIFCERLIRFALMRSRGAGLAEKVADLLKKGEEKKAIDLANESRSPMGRILVQAMDARDGDREILETVIVNATDEEVRYLSAYTQALATIGNIAPILGLLGTVIGMIKAFMVIQQMGGKVNASVLAGGIWEAMLTTALGLAVALPTMVAHSYLISKIDTYEARLQKGSVTFLKSIFTHHQEL